MRQPWTAADTRKLRQLAMRGLSAREIGEAMNRDRRHVADRANRHAIALKRQMVHVPWTQDQVATLRLNYPGWPTFLVAYICGHTESSTYQQAKKLGLSKDPGFVAETTRQRWREGRHEGSRRHQFRKGHEPPNKGRPQAEWMPAVSRAKVARTQFKKGRPAREAHNYVPVGTVKFDRKRGVVVRKLTDDPALYPAGRWRPVHVIVWESVHGPVPEGHIVRFRDGMKTLDPEAITVERLELVTLAENMLRNSYHTRYPPEVRQLIQLKGALNRKINRRTKHHEEHDGRRKEPPGRNARGARRARG